MQTLHAKVQADQEELKAVRKAYDDLHEKHQQLSPCMINQSRRIHSLEVGLLIIQHILSLFKEFMKC